jgi:hypothetical protein
MPRGPQHQRLAHYVDNADPDGLDDAATQWRTGMTLLRQVSKELEQKAKGMKAAESYDDGDVWSGATASTARDAFAKSSLSMHDKAEEMQKGSQAFTDAATGVRDARKTLHQLDNRDPGDQPKAPTFSPGPRTPADETKQSNYDTSVKNWWRDYNANETDAAVAITDLQDNHTTQAAVFQSIHGETKVTPTVQGGGDPTSTTTRPTTTHVTDTNQVNNHDTTGDDDTPHNTDDTDDHDVVDDPHDTSTDTHSNDPTGPGTGVPQGPTTHPTGPLTIPGSTTGGGIGAAGGVGAAAGGALGGVAAAGLAGGLAGGLNGGLNGLVPVGAGGVRGGLSASGVRGIGTTSRTGVGSVLGRGAGGRAGAGGMSTRGGRSGRSAAARGSRGSAGSRGTGAGAGSGRNGRDRKRRGEERDLFDDGADWIDDEDAAPGLLD